MKIINIVKQKLFFSFIILSICAGSLIHCQETADDIEEIATEQETPDVLFSYENEDLSNIINQLAALKNVNVIFPPGETLNTKVTLHIEKKIPLAQAWNLLDTLLDVAGFFIVPQGSIMRIVKSGEEISREPMPTYIGVNPDDLPNTDQPIRYLYYLANIKVSDQPENELNGILKDLLPKNTLIKADSVTNGLLLIAKANDIRSAMKIIMELDQVSFQEKVDIISLHHTSAYLVAELINKELIKSENANPYRLDTKKAKEIPYFSGFTKIVPVTLNNLNKLIILGRPQAVERLKDFIKKYIDVAPDTGESILHVYHLQYLDARDLAPVLQKIVQGGGGENGGPSQASAGEQKGGGVERFFDKVIVYTDSPIDLGKDEANTEIGQQRFISYGGNNLVIAARNDDWKQIKKLIEELDIPQKQVLIEVLIADLTVDDARLLGAMTRMPDKVPLPDDIEFQAAMLGQPIPSELPPVATTTIESDLLKNAYKASSALENPSPGTNNLADFAAAGTTLLSLNDNNGSTWSIWELLQLFSNSKILSHPHVMTRHNKEAIVSIGQTRWLKDKVKDVASNYYGGATTIKFEPISADLRVKITPRISTANTVNLQVFIDINEWQDGPNNVKNIRKLETNANVKSGGIFALGGLIRTTTTSTIAETPILGKIPIIGWFFKRKSNNIRKNNLTVFISPTIVEPRLRAGINEYTQDYIDIAKDYSRGDLFDSLKDPITRWFFKDPIPTAEILDKFSEKDENLAARKNTIQDKDLKKSENPDFDTIDSSDPITRKAGISIAENKIEQLPDLKNIVKDDPNPFLSS
ncbi:MAG TPA: secretin N-terminal domain-containing protein [Candidatus Babeliales bacterium]|nr:secretin N-terminal domain-containing protein [Candidatus Babeliales bacterium]HLC06686.1 secretin N-terminal domain-containing protein [Candidatus Babeliales bacterium]